MIKLYLSTSCGSCRKVREWFVNEHIPFEEVNILKHELTIEDLKEILDKSLDGTDDIISTRSKIFKEQGIDTEHMSMNELLQFIKDNPTVLKRPIIVSDSFIQVGYDADELEIFQRAKRIASESCKECNCPNYQNCQHRFTDTKKAVEEEEECESCQ